MSFMTYIEGSSAMLIKKGGWYKPCDLYEYNGNLFAKWGAQFVRLSDGETTSNIDIHWREIILPDGQYQREPKGLSLQYLPHKAIAAE